MKSEFDLVVESYCKKHRIDKKFLLSQVWELFRLFEEEENIMKALVMYPDEFYFHLDTDTQLKWETYIKDRLYVKLHDYYSERLSIFTDVDVDLVKERAESRVGIVA